MTSSCLYNSGRGLLSRGTGDRVGVWVGAGCGSREAGEGEEGQPDHEATPDLVGA